MVHNRRVTVARARPLVSRSPAKRSTSARRTGEQGQRMGAAPAGELAHVQRVRLAGQPAVPGQEPGEGGPFGLGEGGLDRHQRSRWGGSDHRPCGGLAETRRLAR